MANLRSPLDVVVDRRYHLVGIVHQRLLVHVHHQRHRRPEDVRVQQADAQTASGQRNGQIACAMAACRLYLCWILVEGPRIAGRVSEMD